MCGILSVPRVGVTISRLECDPARDSGCTRTYSSPSGETYSRRDIMGSNETRDWGIWYEGVYTVAHFLKTHGPESKMLRFRTKQDAEAVIVGRWVSSRYEARLIPNPKPLPVKN